MAWSDAQQRLARAVFAAAKAESRYAPMDYPVSVGNYLIRSIDRSRAPVAVRGKMPLGVVNQAVLYVYNRDLDGNRFSGPIPAAQGLPAIDAGRGAIYFSKDVRAQMAELLHYAKDGASRQPGSVPFALDTLEQRCLVLLKPTRDLNLVTMDTEGNRSFAFFDRLQRHGDVRAALNHLRYRDLTQAVFAALDQSPADDAAKDYSAARGLAIGLMTNPDIDGMQISSARNFETGVAGERIFQSGLNVIVFGAQGQVMTDRLRVLSLHLLETTATGRRQSVAYRPDTQGNFVVAGTTRL